MKNGLLRLLVIDANDPINAEKKLSFSVTLSVGGQLISGELISRNEFYNHSQNVPLKHYIDAIEEEERKVSGEIKETPIDKINLIHLRNASYWVNGSKIPSTNGTNIIVNIDSVDAFNMGMLNNG